MIKNTCYIIIIIRFILVNFYRWTPAGFPLTIFLHMLWNKNFWDKWQRFLQAKCLFCHPTNRKYLSHSKTGQQHLLRPFKCHRNTIFKFNAQFILNLAKSFFKLFYIRKLHNICVNFSLQRKMQNAISSSKWLKLPNT